LGELLSVGDKTKIQCHSLKGFSFVSDKMTQSHHNTRWEICLKKSSDLDNKFHHLT
jgi:hypothetical protein